MLYEGVLILDIFHLDPVYMSKKIHCLLTYFNSLH